MVERTEMRRVGERLGILPSYVDNSATRHLTTDETMARLIAAMGVDVSSEDSARREREQIENDLRHRVADPVRVVYADEHHPRLTFNIDGNEATNAILRDESGATVDLTSALIEDRQTRCVHLHWPEHLEHGYYQVRIEHGRGSDRHIAEQLVVVAPRSCYTLHEALGGQPGLGVWANLYSIRSRSNWGIGDLTDLSTLAVATGRAGGDFVGLNPLHATFKRDGRVSPYSPSSRLFNDLLYLDVTAIPEARCAAGQEVVSRPGLQEELAAVRAAERLDHSRLYELKINVLRQLHDLFLSHHQGGATERGRSFAAYRARWESDLVAYATHTAQRETQSSPAERDVAFHGYVQFELDRQLAAAHSAARVSGMRLGLYRDLAVGSAADGADVASFTDCFATGIELGCPPDDFSAEGQAWGFPPVVPHRLRARGYDYWIKLLRANMAHAGMLRLDHVMGLFRQFWVPRDMGPQFGAYVSYPMAELMAILTLESRRHQVVVVGEDLGTVPPEVRPALRHHGLLSTRVMLLERDDGGFREPSHYTDDALVMATNHDYPPLQGYWRGRDLDIRRDAGLLDEPAFIEQQARRGAARGALAQMLTRCGACHEVDEIRDAASLVNAAHRALSEANRALVALSLHDLAGETEPVNMPGITAPQFPAWTARMPRFLEEVLAGCSWSAVPGHLPAGMQDPP